MKLKSSIIATLILAAVISTIISKVTTPEPVPMCDVIKTINSDTSVSYTAPLTECVKLENENV